jgi:hypothetical protein
MTDDTPLETYEEGRGPQYDDDDLDLEEEDE